jgi:hypothetical protein
MLAPVRIKVIQSLIAGLLPFCVFHPDARAAVVASLPTSETVLLGRFARGPVNLPARVTPFEFDEAFGSADPAVWPAEVQARQFFNNGGAALWVIRIAGIGPLANALTGDSNALTGLYAAGQLSDARVLAAPELSLLSGDQFQRAFAEFQAFTEDRGIFLILDPPPGLSAAGAANWAEAMLPGSSANCALYYPYLRIQINGSNITAAASGAMAAIYTRNDLNAGIWNSPAGLALPMKAIALSPQLNSSDLDFLASRNINSIREFADAGIVPWAARTLDVENSENRYIPFVRTRAWIAASLKRSLAFAATNNNAAPLWSEIQAAAANFLYLLYQQGAFAGSTPSQAFFARCDSATTTANDVMAHRVNLIYGIALARPSEFVLSTITTATYDSERQAIPPRLEPLHSSGGFEFAYPTEPGFNYAIESAANPASFPWMPAGAPIVGDGGWRRQSLPATESREFFRVHVTPSR